MKIQHSRGFTLLEVMVSIMLISMLVVIIAGAMSLAYRSIDRGEARSLYLERLKVFFSLMDSQIQSAIPLSREDDEAGGFFFEGSADTVKFASNYSLLEGQRGYVIATYKAVSEGDAGYVFSVSENNIGVENSKDMRVIEGMREIRFEFFRKESESEGVEGQWVSEWAEERLFPRKIRISLTFPDRKIVLTIPVRATKVKT
ncbi:MAG: prepilin-type N-terminal cleavage/methylation domain-containing protein [Syntrophorhabdaceae bacterium]